MEITENNTPEELLEAIWALLVRAGADARHPYHLPVLLSQGMDYPEGRVVVLRKYAQGIFQVYTDARSPKVVQYRDNPSAGLLFWDPGKGLQIRVSGRIQLITDERAEAIFRSLPVEQTTDYRHRNTPGTPLSSPIAGREVLSDNHYFCLMELMAERLDVLQIRRTGHLRLRYERSLAGSWTGTWITP